MNIVEIIEKKRDNFALSKTEIDYFIKEYCDGNIAEYQASALLMAIFFNGLNDKELYYLTDAMIETGVKLDFSEYEGIFVDKHSTGGVGDKTTIALAPILAACGLKVAKMSGRGLSFTGGTLDKLESIPGFNVLLSDEEFEKQIKEIGVSIIGQTSNMVYADKKLYALRDVTGTVNSIPLIASSIMSKKIAAGSDVILLDVKCGDGAFMNNLEDAEELAKRMIAIGKSFNKRVRVEITSMNDVLGNTVGNSLEVEEAIETLRGNVHNDFYELCVHSATTLLMEAGLAQTSDEAEDMVKTSIDNGAALQKLKEMITYQGGDAKVVGNPKLLSISDKTKDIVATQSGYINEVKVKQLGLIACELGAGRMVVEDEIDPSVGLIVHKKHGEYVSEGDVLCTLYYQSEVNETLYEKTLNSFILQNEKVKREPLIYKVL